MKKSSNTFLPALVLCAYLLCPLSFGEAKDNSKISGQQASTHLYQKTNDMRLGNLPINTRDRILQHLKKAEYEIDSYERILPSGKISRYRAFNRNENMSIYFSDHGVHLLPRGKGDLSWHLEMMFSGCGYDGAADFAPPLQPQSIIASGHSVEYQRGVLAEWYVNGERGFEQGVTLSAPPTGKEKGSLVVEWAVSGSLKPRLEKQGTVITFYNAAAEPVLRYSGLKAWDATGRLLSAKLSVRSTDSQDNKSRIAYVIDAANASYPVIIDPVFTQAKKITASDGVSGDLFGDSVSISGDTLVVGAVGVDDSGTASGAAYIFDRNQGGADNWGQAKRITASDAAANDSFGASVSISGDTVVVGAYGDSDNGNVSGSAYIFERNRGGADNWGQTKKITAADGAASDRFGNSVSISGDTVVVGANGNSEPAYATGSAYIFERNQGGADNWGQVKKIVTSDGVANDNFGISVSISGDTVVGGASGDDDNGSISGSAYVFDRNQGGADNWGQTKKITASDGAASANFGHSVSVSGDTVVVGAYGDKENGVASGAAYVFERNQGGADNWGQVVKITATDAAAADLFGEYVAISGDTVVVGAWGGDDDGTNSGSAYIFGRNQGGAGNWGQMVKITASDAAANDRFGQSVSISGATVVVGAGADDDEGIDSGAAYIFTAASKAVASLVVAPIILLLMEGP